MTNRPSSWKRAAILAFAILFTPVGFLQGQSKQAPAKDSKATAAASDQSAQAESADYVGAQVCQTCCC
jgi:hypothetical protein